MTVNDMRKLYPHPMTSQAHSRLECPGLGRCNHYDVPGALICALTGFRATFPTTASFMRYLKPLLPAALYPDLKVHAIGICLLNDTGDFNGAWALLATLIGEDLAKEKEDE